jgi:hypothetical protein
MVVAMSTGDGPTDDEPDDGGDATRETGALWPAPPAAPPQTPLAPAPSAPLLSAELKRKLMIGGGAAVGLVIFVIIVSSTCGGSKHAAPPAAAGPDLATQASDLLAKGDAQGAADLLEPALASPTAHTTARTYLALGHARFLLGRRLDALGAYEHAIVLDAAIGADPALRSNVTKVLDKGEPVASVVALELLATGIDPPARDTIVAQASTSKLLEVRHRAFAIAERLGVADQIDRVESWSADLRQAATCEERRTAVLKLRATGDKRAIGALKKAQTQFPCIAKDAGDAVTALGG